MREHSFKAYLKRRHITQAEVSRRTGVLPTRLSEVFSGRVRNFSKKDAKRIHAVFGDFPVEKLLWARPEADES